VPGRRKEGHNRGRTRIGAALAQYSGYDIHLFLWLCRPCLCWTNCMKDPKGTARPSSELDHTSAVRGISPLVPLSPCRVVSMHAFAISSASIQSFHSSATFHDKTPKTPCIRHLIPFKPKRKDHSLTRSVQRKLLRVSFCRVVPESMLAAGPAVRLARKRERR